jgi:hypothetical protein
MNSIDVGAKTLLLPSMVPSISSFETQMFVNDAISLQKALNEPISLVSAYDFKDASTSAKLVDSCKRFSEGGILMLDSGGYESSRIRRYASNKSTDWNFSQYKDVCEKVNADLIFSFDYFIGAGESANDFAIRLVQHCHDEHSFVPSGKLIPVVHILSNDGSRTLIDNELKEVISRVAHELTPSLIAIPERELGAGILSKSLKVKRIVQILSTMKTPPRLHILGCGNLLSFAFLACSGAAVFDGLEWCRTFIDERFHLHHFQQGDLFDFADFESQGHEWLANKFRGQYPIRVAIQNLSALQNFSSKLRAAIESNSVVELIRKYYGERAAAALDGIVK